MFILGIQGSPRTSGNSRWLLTSFLEECEKYGATTHVIDACKADIQPCKELIVCEKKGYCPLKDDMEQTIYPLIRKADIVVLASSVFFYNVTAQVKLLIDRCQMFWGRKYKLKLKDPRSYNRQGFLLSVGASGGKKLFDGVNLTAKYFFDAISAKDQGGLTYKHIESAKQIRSHPTVEEDIKKAVKDLCRPWLEKKSILFLSKHDACRGQIAGALARIHARERLIIETAGYDAKARVVPQLVSFMEKRHLDLMYQIPRQFEKIKPDRMPDIVITLGSEEQGNKLFDGNYQNWEIKAVEEPSTQSLKNLMDELEPRIEALVTSLIDA